MTIPHVAWMPPQDDEDDPRCLILTGTVLKHDDSGGVFTDDERDQFFFAFTDWLGERGLCYGGGIGYAPGPEQWEADRLSEREGELMGESKPTWDGLLEERNQLRKRIMALERALLAHFGQATQSVGEHAYWCAYHASHGVAPCGCGRAVLNPQQPSEEASDANLR